MPTTYVVGIRQAFRCTSVRELSTGQANQHFFCCPAGNCAQCGGADSLCPLQLPLRFLHWPGGGNADATPAVLTTPPEISAAATATRRMFRPTCFMVASYWSGSVTEHNRTRRH